MFQWVQTPGFNLKKWEPRALDKNIFFRRYARAVPAPRVDQFVSNSLLIKMTSFGCLLSKDQFTGLSLSPPNWRNFTIREDWDAWFFFTFAENVYEMLCIAALFGPSEYPNHISKSSQLNSSNETVRTRRSSGWRPVGTDYLFISESSTCDVWMHDPLVILVTG